MQKNHVFKKISAARKVQVLTISCEFGRITLGRIIAHFFRENCALEKISFVSKVYVLTIRDEK